MIIIFLRHVNQNNSVTSKVQSIEEGHVTDIGIMQFPNKQMWNKVIGAMQRGAIGVSDLEVRLENSNDEISLGVKK